MARPARTAAGRHRLGGHGGFRKKADEEEVDPDVVAMTSEPAWKAEVEAKQKEAIRQGQLSASRAVSREASSRRFVVLAEGGGDPRAGGSAVDTSTAHDRPATFCWEARRAQPSNTSQAFFNSFRASRVSATSSQPAVQKLGRELSLSDSYEGAVYSDNTAYRSRKLGSASRCPGGLFGRPPALHTAPSSVSLLTAQAAVRVAMSRSLRPCAACRARAGHAHCPSATGGAPAAVPDQGARAASRHVRLSSNLTRPLCGGHERQ